MPTKNKEIRKQQNKRQYIKKVGAEKVGAEKVGAEKVGAEKVGAEKHNINLREVIKEFNDKKTAYFEFKLLKHKFKLNVLSRLEK